MKEIRVLGLHIFDRVKESGKTQEVLTRYGDNIKTRFGFHELSEDVCSREGIILLELTGNTEAWDALENELKQIFGVTVKRMHFSV